MSWEITGVGRVAENAVALFVRRMLDGVSGHCVAGKAELIARRGKSDVGGAFHVGDRVAGGAAHGDSGVDVLPCGLVVVALETFGGINVGGEKDGMLVEVGASRRSEKQQDDSSQGAERKSKQWRGWESGGDHHLSRAKILFADPCIPADPRYRRCKERLRFGAPHKASAGMVHLKNHFQYLGPGNCSQLLKLMLFCNIVLPITLLRGNVVYIVAGATHPHVRRREGDRYRLQLQALAKELGVGENVVFHNRFVSPQEMASLVGSADIYVTPYRYEAQAVSGTLAYALGAGKAIISAPYWHAAELLDSGRGVLVPFEDPAAIADTAIELLDNDAARQAMRKRAYLYARHMVWDQVAQSYMRTFLRSCANRMQPARVAFSLHAAEKNATSRLINA
jgi:hypothetical protein